MKLLRGACLSFVFAFLIATLGPEHLQAGPVVTSVFDFNGVCAPGDCTGSGHGVLTVQNYTQGTAFTNGNFVSFSYSSNLISVFSITAASLTTFSGSMPASLPAAASVMIIGNAVGQMFQSNTDGSWCVANSCNPPEDQGLSSVWSPATGVPEPVTSVLMAAGLAALSLARMRRSRVPVIRP